MHRVFPVYGVWGASKSNPWIPLKGLNWRILGGLGSGRYRMEIWEEDVFFLEHCMVLEQHNGMCSKLHKPEPLILYSTIFQRKTPHVALGNTPNARILRWGYQHVGV